MIKTSSILKMGFYFTFCFLFGLSTYGNGNCNAVASSKIEVLTSAAAALTSITGEIHSLLYIASGVFDVESAFMLAPNALTVIGADDHPFSLGSNQDSLVVPREHEYGMWAHVHDVDLAKSARENLLSSLFRWKPHVKVIKVESYNQDGQSHGLIEFDIGDGQVRRYHHIQISIEPSFFEDPAPRLTQLIRAIKPNGLLVKASMSAYGEGLLSRVDLHTEASNHAMSVVRRGGVVIDCDGKDWQQVGSVQKSSSFGAKLGYSQTVVAYKFKQKK